MKQIPSKSTFLQLNKKLLAFEGTRKFITTVTGFSNSEDLFYILWLVSSWNEGLLDPPASILRPTLKMVDHTLSTVRRIIFITYQWCANRGLPKLHVRLRKSSKILIYAPPSEGRTTFYESVNFAVLFTFGQNVLSSNGISTSCISRCCILETLRSWGEKIVRGGKLHHSSYSLSSKYVLIIIMNIKTYFGNNFIKDDSLYLKNNTGKDNRQTFHSCSSVLTK